jgi:hypothetical protein
MGMVGLVQTQRQSENQGEEEERAHARAFAKYRGGILASPRTFHGVLHDRGNAIAACGNVFARCMVWFQANTNFVGGPIAMRVIRKEVCRSSERRDRDGIAAEALELARQMPPGPERNEALKAASRLRCSADAHGIVFAKRGRPRK